jgi:hypothetical protein
MGVTALRKVLLLRREKLWRVNLMSVGGMK